MDLLRPRYSGYQIFILLSYTSFLTYYDVVVSNLFISYKLEMV